MTYNVQGACEIISLKSRGRVLYEYYKALYASYTYFIIAFKYFFFFNYIINSTFLIINK